mmetsp:Transcript_23908/g.67177  ORF Transcript_23908/g.67177 Transcript_23908/m.67177 type:complete len:483 (+) Transcript_23908:124-1572(+)
MITYDSGGIYHLLNIAKVHGSVFPSAVLISLPCACITGILVVCIHNIGILSDFRDEDALMNDNAVWGGFSFLVGFLVVFRTSQAYNRFWEGCTNIHGMSSKWFDSCAALMSFCKYSTADEKLVLQFQNTLIRLFSMIHAAALGEIEDCGDGVHYSQVTAFNMELIDAQAIDRNSLMSIRDSDSKVELIFQWIQQLIVVNIKTGVLSIPPPILTRAFQEIAGGMVHFRDAMKISSVPFPFPYAQTCDCILLMHWLAVPLVVAPWVSELWWGVVFSFIQVFTLWTLNLIAVELENPFGTDPNDIDGESQQLIMNTHLRLLLRRETLTIPTLVDGEVGHQEQLVANAVHGDGEAGRSCLSFNQLWNDAQDGVPAARNCSSIVNGRTSGESRGSRGTTIVQPPHEEKAGETGAAARPRRPTNVILGRRQDHLCDGENGWLGPWPDADGAHADIKGMSPLKLSTSSFKLGIDEDPQAAPLSFDTTFV